MKKYLFIIVFLFLFSNMFFSMDITLVLSGGGARGVYQLGVWKALIDNGYNIDGVYGTSVGAINGAAVAMGDYESAKNLWMQIDTNRLMEVDSKILNILKTDMTFETISDYFSLVWKLILENGIKIQPMVEFVYNSIDEEAIRNSTVDFGLVTVNYSNFKGQELFIEEIPEGKLLDYILASSNFPGFERYVIEEEKYIDGGFYSNVPVSMAIDRGSKNILSVVMSLQVPRDIIANIKAYFDKDINHIQVSPSMELGGFLDFEPDVYYNYIKLGYLDTQRVLDNLTGKEYFIINESYEYLKKLLLDMPIGDLESAFSLLNLEYNWNVSIEYNYYRILLPFFERISFKSSPTEVLNDIIEKVAQYLEIEKLSPYTRLDLMTEISSSDKKVASNKENSFVILNKRVYYNNLIDFFKFIINNSDYYENSEYSSEFKKMFKDI